MGAAKTANFPNRAPPKAVKVKRFRVKMITMGNSDSGKTALTERYCKDTFTHRYESTVGVSHFVRGVKFGNVEIRVNIWDLGGSQESFEIRNEFYKDAQAAVLLYDASNRQSFEDLNKWRDEAVQFGGRDIIMAVAATKCDLRTRYVTREEGEYWATQHGCPFFEVSAQSGSQVAQVFASLLSRVLPTMAGVPQDTISESIRHINSATCGEKGHAKKQAGRSPRPESAVPPLFSKPPMASAAKPQVPRARDQTSQPEEVSTPSFSSSYSFSYGSRPARPPEAITPSASFSRRTSQSEVEARMQERKAEWTQQEREREHQEAARAVIRDRVKKNLSRVETFTDLASILTAFGYKCSSKDEVKKVFRTAVVELHPDKLGNVPMEEAVRKEEMFKILMGKKNLL
mmetsp:Transcript_40409/g.114419  ORF Transcript_40409/g.114419 Transcript_40409/m.114419 type:complete len:401 (-) Transcript_40409:19-1221(-)|eukprot:CAMPEP_0117652402 /NCGR_PEP_ID=MMETSP0804-20121206/2609_1 /TAXON_ID=1074897 /ORGANISM="Tetraselmis astigmatica, Strain CCMP880" /LENGTH=400 /DNA_ID=CAMNT_0005458449 /DNA_START=169 /DNA_END=1371 /DNA_ORIENTATION=+